MITTKETLLKGTVHFLEIDDILYIPDWVIEYKLVNDENVNFEFENVDCLFSHHNVIKQKAILKPTALESFNFTTYKELLGSKHKPKIIYVFKSGILNLEKVIIKYFS